MILGTAGHIDHGKTTLVRALTGVDTDRLPEEKRRGITIDLGFAPLELEGVGTVGVVDVPGHEAFVRTMLAGATGIDLALLVVAADEGVMPQTREHLAILDLLGVRAGVVALTKRDLVEEDWLALVEEDVRALLADTPLADAPIVPCSATTGAGLDALRRALADAARSLPRRDSDDLFRMPVDRAFTVRGTGTVVTGTVWSGRLLRDATVRLLPSGRTVRVRGLQTHGAAVECAEAGQRTAIALAGVDVADAGRGTVVVTDPAWRPSRLLRADVVLLHDAPQPLRPRTSVRFHLGTVEVGARVVARGGVLAPGDRRAARIVLDEPVVARAGDRFVLRSASPVATLGGGIVTDPLAPPRARPWDEGLAPPRDRLLLLLAEAGAHGVDLQSIPVRLGIRPADADGVVRSLGDEAVRVEDHLVARALLSALETRLDALVDEYHETNPLEPHAPLQLIRSRLGAPPALADLVVRARTRAGALTVDGGGVRRAGWTPRLGGAGELTRHAILQELLDAGHEPPSVAELAARHGAQTEGLLRLLEREGLVTQVEMGRYYATAALDGLVDALRQGMKAGAEYGPAELRELLGFSRKYLIPFLEYCDRRGLTTRQAGGRVWRGT